MTPNSPQKLQDAADEFEAMLVENMLHSMRSTLEEESEEGQESDEGLGKETYYDLMYQQLARAISKNARIGVAEMIKTKVDAMEKMRQNAKEVMSGQSSMHSSIMVSR